MKWKTKPLVELTHVVTKGTTPTTIGRQFTSTGINFIKAEALNGDSSLDSQSFAFIDDETHEALLRSKLEADDILVTIAGASVGRCGFVKPELTPANTNQAVGIIRVDKQKANSRFVYFFFKQPDTFALCQSLGAAQAAQPNVTLAALRGFQIPYPPIHEQNRIASILSAYDDAIENNRRRMALMEKAARLLYEEWFVRLHFPGHKHTPITNGLPQGWKKKTALDATDVLSGGTPKTSNPDFWGGEIPFYTPKDATDGFWVTDCERTLTELGIKKCNSRLYPKETVFITARGTVGKLNLAQRPMAMSQSCYALIAKGHLSQLFLFSAMQAAVEELRQHAVGAVFDAIIVDTFKRINLLIPEPRLVRLFDETVFPIFAQIENLTLQNQKLRTARDLLLPRLMSGEIEV